MKPYIIDESEQVFSHVTARTIRNAQHVMLRLHYYVSKSPSIYLFDADLNQVTFYFVGSARLHNAKQPIRTILNRYTCENRICELYKSPTQLLAEMLQSARQGKRLFVTCNSKNRAQVYARLLRKEVGESLRVLLVTAEDKISDEVQDFLEDVPRKILEYDVVVCSPAIGTGIDISFPGDAAEIDIVYGFFIAGINSHYDVDQQLGRVRNPKEVKVWISGRRNRFETDFEAIKRDIVRVDDAHGAVTSFSDAGLPIVDWEHPLLVLQAMAYCAQRASQNRLKELFISHKQRNGWKIVHIDKTTKESKTIGQMANRAKQDYEIERRQGILAATSIDQYDWKDYFDRIAKGDTVSQAVKSQMAAFELRSFYNLPLNDDLIELDAQGSYRAKVLLFEKLRLRNPQVASILLRRWNSGNFELGERIGEIPIRCIAGAIVSAGLINADGFNTNQVVTRADLKQFLGFCDVNYKSIERDLGIAFRDDRNHNPVRALNQILDLVGLELEILGKTKKNGAAIYLYKLNEGMLKTMSDIIEARGKPRCDLPEMLDPPRPRRRNPAAGRLQPDTLCALFEPDAPPGG